MCATPLSRLQLSLTWSCFACCFTRLKPHRRIYRYLYCMLPRRDGEEHRARDHKCLKIQTQPFRHVATAGLQQHLCQPVVCLLPRGSGSPDIHFGPCLEQVQHRRSAANLFRCSRSLIKWSGDRQPISCSALRSERWQRRMWRRRGSLVPRCRSQRWRSSSASSGRRWQTTRSSGAATSCTIPTVQCHASLPLAVAYIPATQLDRFGTRHGACHCLQAHAQQHSTDSTSVVLTANCNNVKQVQGSCEGEGRGPDGCAAGGACRCRRRRRPGRCAGRRAGRRRSQRRQGRGGQRTPG